MRFLGRRVSSVSLAAAWWPAIARTLLLALLLAIAIAPRVARCDAPAGVEAEIVAAFHDTLLAGYEKCNADKVLEMYHGDARIATFTRGVLALDAFAPLLRESIGRNSAMDASLEFDGIAFSGEEALVPLRLTLGNTDAAGNRRVTTDRLYCRMVKHGSWKITMQTYRPDFTLPAPGVPGAHH